MFKTLTIAAFATALLVAAAPAHAACWCNGTSLNGLSNNALTANALSENALTQNALSGNALTRNSIRSTAVAASQHLGTASGLRVIAVELPAAR